METWNHNNGPLQNENAALEKTPLETEDRAHVTGRVALHVQ